MNQVYVDKTQNNKNEHRKGKGREDQPSSNKPGMGKGFSVQHENSGGMLVVVLPLPTNFCGTWFGLMSGITYVDPHLTLPLHGEKVKGLTV